MADYGKETELLTKNENITSLEEQSDIEGEGKSKSKSLKEKSTDTKEYRKKKQDALEGKDSTKMESDESDSEGKGHHAAEKAEADETGSHREGLQSGQTTVQFSSGGGIGGGNANMATSLTSLLGLFASSAALVRAEGGSILNVANQTANLNLRYFIQATSSQLGSLIGEEGKAVKGAVISTEQSSIETSGNKFGVDTGTTSVTHGSGSTQDTLVGLITPISTRGGDHTGDNGNTTTITIFSTGGIIPYIGFNPNAFFFPNTIQFAFPNSTTGTPITVDGTTVTPLTPFSGVIGGYLGAAHFRATGPFEYQILGPTTDVLLPPTPGLTVAQTLTIPPPTSPTTYSAVYDTVTDLYKTQHNVVAGQTLTQPVVTTETTGITLTPNGDVYVNVLSPMSVLVNVTTPGGTTPLPVRIDGGPGDLVPDAPNNLFMPNMIFGNAATLLAFNNGVNPGIDGIFSPKGNIFRISSTAGAVGNGAGLNIDLGGNVTYALGAGNASLGHFQLPSNFEYEFPSSLIFRHVGNSLTTIPQTATYGNFTTEGGASLNIINLPISTPFGSNPSAYNLTFGGNVLDVFGTKYGIADSLIINLSPGPFPSAVHNIITLGGNTLAGFGTSYGSLHDLIITAGSSPTPANIPPTDIIFNGDVLWVDKNIDSVLVPQLLTLDFEIPQITGNSYSLSNVSIIFKDNIIHGNTGKNTFYGDVWNLGDQTQTGRYNGFINGVTVDLTGGVVKTTAPDLSVNLGVGAIFTASGDSITWSNDTYTGGHDAQNSSGVDTYNFTLLGTINANPSHINPIFLGNATITDFQASTDILNFQLTPALFRSLDGLDGTGHTKHITAADLDNAVSVSGRTVIFNGGGSLDFAGPYHPGHDNPFSGLPTGSVTFEIMNTYSQIAPIPANLIVTSPGGISGPASANNPPIVYGLAPNSINSITQYFNEFDNYFTGSLLATYTTSLSPTASGSLTANISIDPSTGALAFVGSTSSADITLNANSLAPNTIAVDHYGDIVFNNLVPILTPLTITGTDEQGHTATNTLLFGFLNQQEITAAPNAEIIGPNILNRIANIITGGVGSTIVGGTDQNTRGDTLTIISDGVKVGTPLLPSLNPSNGQLSGNNLIVDTGGSGKAYGSFLKMDFTTQGDSLDYTSNGGGREAIASHTWALGSNAFDVYGTTYGVTGSFDVAATGGSNSTLELSKIFHKPNINDSAHFDNNTFNIGFQNLYGNGMLIGDIDSMNFTISGGSNTSFHLTPSNGFTAANVSGTFDDSGWMSGNVFNFAPTYITITGDFPGQVNNLSANVNKLNIIAQTIYQTNPYPAITFDDTAHVVANKFIFQDSTLTGGVGTNIYQGHLSYLGDPFGYTNTNQVYNGFVNGVIVGSTPDITNPTLNYVTITDSQGNMIQWGNDTYKLVSDAHGTNIYNFTIVEDLVTPTVGDPHPLAHPVMQGNDTIENFVISKSFIELNIESNLFGSLHMVAGDNVGNAGILDQNHDVSVIGSATGLKITFTGGGGMDYGSITLLGFDGTSISTLAGFATYQTSPNLIITSIGTAYKPISLASPQPLFDPVLINSEYPNTFVNFIDANPTTLTYSATSTLNGTAIPANNPSVENQTPPVADFTILPGVVLDALGNIFVNTPTPVDGNIYIQVTDSISPLSLNPLHIFALTTTDQTIHTDTTSSVVGDATATQAFETKTAGNLIIGGGNNDSSGTWGAVSGPIGGNQNSILTFAPDPSSSSSSPTDPVNALIYGSKLIYDISSGGHTAIGDALVVIFRDNGTYRTDDATPDTLTTLNDQTITFSPNTFNVNLNNSGSTIFGDTTALSMTAAGGEDSLGRINTQIQGNTITFGHNVEYGNGIDYGALQDLSLLIIDPDATTTTSLPVGNATISGNIFKFEGSNITGDYVPSNIGSANAAPSTIYPEIGTLVIANNETTHFTHAGTSVIGGSTPADGNQFIFKDSILTAGVGATHFYGDIGDLSNTDFVIGNVTIVSGTPAGVVEIMDSQNNTITWGNDKYYDSPSGSSTNTYTFTLMDVGGINFDPQGKPIVNVAMQGNAILEGFKPSVDILDLKLAPSIFRAINTNYDRAITSSEIQSSTFTTFDKTTIPGSTILTYDAGSITLMNQSITSYANLSHVQAELAYTNATVTAASNPQPIILLPTEGTNGGTGGVYGNILDPLFNNLDIGNTGSTYKVANFFDSTIMATFPTLAMPANITYSTDKFGTLTATPSSTALSPQLTPVLVTVHDVHTNGPQGTDVPTLAIIGTFDTTTTGNTITGTHLTDTPTTTIFDGSITGPSFLDGKASNEVLDGNADLTVISNGSANMTGTSILTYGSNQFGGNMIINTAPGSIANGDFQSFEFNATANSAGALGPRNLTVSGFNYDFATNAMDINGSSSGVADQFNINVLNLVSGLTFTGVGSPTGINDFAIHFLNNTFTFEAQTLYGQGTITGDVNTFNLNASGATNMTFIADPADLSGTNPPGQTLDVSAYATQNIFDFKPTTIVVIGNSPTNAFTHVDTLILPQDNITTTNNLTTGVGFTNNRIVFEAGFVRAGAGGGIIYTDVNDMSSTPFWNTPIVVTTTAIDHQVIQENTGHNDIQTGDTTIILDPGKTAQDIISMNVLENNLFGPDAPVLLEHSVTITNFDTTMDFVRLNISPLLYDILQGNGGVTAANFLSLPGLGLGGTDSITFSEFGTVYETIKFTNLTGISTLSDFAPFIQIGTTLTGTNATDTYTFTVPSASGFGTFQEYDQIGQFQTATQQSGANPDVIKIIIPQSLYDLGESGILTGATPLGAIEANAGTVAGGIKVLTSPAAFTSSNGVAYDSTLQFMSNGTPSGSILLHNVNLGDPVTGANPTLENLGNQLQLAQQGTSGTDTFTYFIPGNDFTSFTQNSSITNYTTPSAASPTNTADNLQFILTPILYEKISSDGTLLGTVDAAALEAHALASDPIGGLFITKSEIQFLGNNTISGSITLDNADLTDPQHPNTNPSLSYLGSHLHVGFVEQGAPGQVDTFAFTPYQYTHIIDFDTSSATKDVLQMVLSKSDFANLNGNDYTSGNPLSLNAINGTVVVAQQTAQYYDSNGVDVDTTVHLTAETSGVTLHNVNTDLATLIANGELETGYTQDATGNPLTPVTFLLPQNATSFSEYTEFNHVGSFNTGVDNLQIVLPVTLYDALSETGNISGSAGTTLGTVTVADLSAHINDTIGGITVVETPTIDGSGYDANLEFVNNTSPQPFGDIVLHNVNLGDSGTGANASLTALGSHLQIGYAQQGATGTSDTFTFFVSDDGGNHFTSFSQFDHIIDFNNSSINNTDNLQIVLPISVFSALSGDPTLATAVTGSELESASNIAGTVGGIKVTSHASDFASNNGVTTDTILSFVANGQTNSPSGSIDLHNVSLPSNDIGNIKNLQIGFMEHGSAAGGGETAQALTFNITGSDFTSFHQFDHILDFNNHAIGGDTLTLKLSAALYDTLDGTTLNPVTVDAALLENPTNASGTHINVAQVTESNGVHDAILQFVNASNAVFGSITIHNSSINHLTDIHNLAITHS